MDRVPPSRHSWLDRDLNRLRDNVLRLSSMADQAVDLSIRALKETDSSLAQSVISNDKAINQFRYSIEQDCYKIIAMQQPTARDMRALITAIHVVVELERIGDYATGIAKLTLRIERETILKPIPELLTMHRISKDMLKNSMDAYLNWDVELAQKAFLLDKEVDALDKLAGDKWIKLMQEHPEHIRSGTYLLWITHNIERIADRITNICERVIFMVTGKMSAEEDG